MELRGKDRRFLRGLGVNLQAHIRISGGEVKDTHLDEIDAALEKNELVKIKLIGSMAKDEKKALAESLAKKTDSELIQVVGSAILLYKENPQNRQIRIPK
jgi:RNA-binding protein